MIHESPPPPIPSEKLSCTQLFKASESMFCWAMSQLAMHGSHYKDSKDKYNDKYMGQDKDRDR